MQKRVEIGGEGERGCHVVYPVGWFSAFKDFTPPCFNGLLRDDNKPEKFCAAANTPDAVVTIDPTGDVGRTGAS